MTILNRIETELNRIGETNNGIVTGTEGIENALNRIVTSIGGRMTGILK